jgi:hypothetical protein
MTPGLTILPLMALLLYACVVGFGFWLAWQGVMALRGIQRGMDEIAQTLRRMESRQAGS